MILLALIGFGEVGQTFAKGLTDNGGVRLAAYDLLFDDLEKRRELIARAEALGVRVAADAADASRDAHIVISAVTAAAAGEVAKTAGGYLRRGQIFLDVNSASPRTKQMAAKHVEAAGARFVEAAVMAAVASPGLEVPILAGGPAAATAAEILNALGMNLTPVALEHGRASATKLARSIVMKGLEAALVQSAAAAQRWGVEAEVIASLKETYPGIDWPKAIAHARERVAKHGVRRAEEMREAGRMLEDLGLDPGLCRAVAAVQEGSMTSPVDSAGRRRRPRFRLPHGTCDAHCHVFGPAARFPYAQDRRYTPADAPKEALAALHAHLGVGRAVIVQASCHGTDNAAMLDAIAAAPETTRGVAIVDDGFRDGTLAALHDGGVRGVRFNFVRRLGGPPDLGVLRRVVERIAPLGWHVVLHLEASDIVALSPLMRALPVAFVIDHMGRVDAGLGSRQPAVEALVELAKLDGCWIKLSGAERISQPPFSAAVPIARRLLTACPDRVLWGTDFPHPNLNIAVDEADLVDLVPAFAETEEAQRRLLVDNPARLYGF